MKKLIAAAALVVLFSATAVMAASPETAARVGHFCANLLCADCPFSG